MCVCFQRNREAEERPPAVARCRIILNCRASKLTKVAHQSSPFPFVCTHTTGPKLHHTRARTQTHTLTHSHTIHTRCLQQHTPPPPREATRIHNTHALAQRTNTNARERRQRRRPPPPHTVSLPLAHVARTQKIDRSRALPPPPPPPLSPPPPPPPSYFTRLSLSAARVRVLSPRRCFAQRGLVWLKRFRVCLALAFVGSIVKHHRYFRRAVSPIFMH